MLVYGAGEFFKEHVMDIYGWGAMWRYESSTIISLPAQPKIAVCSRNVTIFHWNAREGCCLGWVRVRGEFNQNGFLTPHWAGQRSKPNAKWCWCSSHHYPGLQLHGASGDYCFCSQSPGSHWKPNISLCFFSLEGAGPFTLITLAERWPRQKLTSRSSTISIIKDIGPSLWHRGIA